MVRLAGRYHKQNPIRTVALLAGFDGSVHRSFPNGDSGRLDIGQQVGHFFAGAETFHDIVGILELGHPPGIPEIGDLDSFEPGQDQLFGDPQFCIGRYKKISSCWNPSLTVISPKTTFLGYGNCAMGILLSGSLFKQLLKSSQHSVTG